MHSATLAIDETLRARRAAGEKVLHLGFGEAGLPVPQPVAAVLAEAAGRNGYGPVAGAEETRDAAAAWFARRGRATAAEQVLIAPGSKPLLFALLAALPGDVVLPRPSWVSYAAQAALAGKRIVWVPVPAECGGLPDPERLEGALKDARAAGAQPGVMVLTVPDNPTGTVARAEQLAAVCAIAERHGIAVVGDEIYGELVHDLRDPLPDDLRGGEGSVSGAGSGGAPDAVSYRAPSAASYLPERTVLTTGLSKSMALGGWRLGFARVPEGAWGERVRQDLIGIASEVWSCAAAPVQAAAAYVLRDPAEVLAHIAGARRLHATLARAVHAEFAAAGATCRPPEAGFYLYPDFEPLRPQLAARGIGGGAALAGTLLERHGVGVLAGEAFGDEPEALRVRVATSLLYGESADERWQALRSEDPVALPWIAASLNHLRAALGGLTAP